MSTHQLYYVGEAIADSLANDVEANIGRYTSGDFKDLSTAGDWEIPLNCCFDRDALLSLNPDGSGGAEINNSLLVWSAFAGLSTRLSRENRLWVRISHIECLDYARSRWLNSSWPPERLANAIRKHFFAPTLTRARDDHAISRLWWNAWIAHRLMPEAPRRALELFLGRADTRLNFVERPWIAARPKLGGAILRVMDCDPRALESESAFRVLMIQVNLQGAGIAFELWPDARIETFIKHCLDSTDAVMRLPA